MYIDLSYYLNNGGKQSMTDAAFIRNEFRARKIVDRLTQGRVKNMAEVPEAVKRLMVELVTLESTQGAEITQGKCVTSFSNDGYSETYADPLTGEQVKEHYMYGVASSDNTASVTAYLGGSWRFGNKSSTKTPTTNADMIYSGDVDSSKITITGSAATISGVNEFETVGSLLLGSCRGSAGSIGAAQFSGKIFFFAMWQEDVQVLKLVPVVSTDGVYRFYDEVSGTFFDSITDTPLEGGNL